MKIGWDPLQIDGKTIPLSFACKQSICKSADESECFRMSKLVWSFTGEMNESENCKQNEIWMSIGEVERSEVQRIIPLLISLEYKGNELFSASYRHFWWSGHRAWLLSHSYRTCVESIVGWMRTYQWTNIQLIKCLEKFRRENLIKHKGKLNSLVWSKSIRTIDPVDHTRWIRVNEGCIKWLWWELTTWRISSALIVLPLRAASQSLKRKFPSDLTRSLVDRSFFFVQGCLEAHCTVIWNNKKFDRSLDPTIESLTSVLQSYKGTNSNLSLLTNSSD